MTDSIAIKTPPAAHRQFLIPLQARTAGTNSPAFSLSYGTTIIPGPENLIETNAPSQAQSYQCNLTSIRKVRITSLPFGGFWCVVFGRDPIPRINNSANLHVFPEYFVPPGLNDPALTGFSSLNGHAVEMELGTDYRYFTAYIYSETTSPTQYQLTPVSASYLGQYAFNPYRAFLSVTFTGN